MSSGPSEDKSVEVGAKYTTLAARHNHHSIVRRRLGKKGTWWELQRCLVDPSAVPSNGLMDFEIRVWR